MTTKTTRSEICEGVRYLDTEYPEWLEAINLDELDLSMSSDCILGQLNHEAVIGEVNPASYDGKGSFGEALAVMFPDENPLDRDLWAESYGFFVYDPSRFDDCQSTSAAYSLLNEEWRVVIKAKRAGESDGC